jgi:hypothetical protein
MRSLSPESVSSRNRPLLPLCRPDPDAVFGVEQEAAVERRLLGHFEVDLVHQDGERTRRDVETLDRARVVAVREVDLALEVEGNGRRRSAQRPRGRPRPHQARAACC